MRAYGIGDQRRDNTRRAAALRLLARVSRVRDGNSVQAIAILERALALSQLGEDVQLRTEILCDLGDACRDSGETGRAKESWRRALEIARLAGFNQLITELQARLRSGPTDRGDGATEIAAP